MKTKYGLNGRLIAKKGEGEALAAILLEAAKILSHHEGCHVYMVSLDQHATDEVVINEVWEDQEAHQASLQLEEVRALIGKAMPLIASPPTKGTELIVLGGKM